MTKKVKMFKSCKLKKINFSIFKKFVAILLSMFLSLPFFNVYISADEFSYDIETTTLDISTFKAFQYFINHGLSTELNKITYTNNQSANIGFNDINITTTYDLDASVPRITLSVPAHNLTTTLRDIVPDGTYAFNVYKGGDWMGALQSYTVQNNKVYFVYGLGESTQLCSTSQCHLRMQPVDIYQLTDYYNVTINENAYNETISSFNIDITGSSTTALNNLKGNIQSKLNYQYTNVLSLPYIKGTYKSSVTYIGEKGSTIPRNSIYTIAFYLRKTDLNVANLNIQILENQNQGVLTATTNIRDTGGYRLYVIEISNPSNSGVAFDIDFNAMNNKNVMVIPVAYDLKQNLDNNIYTYLYGDKYVPFIDDIETNQQTQITNQNTIISRLNTVITNLTTGNTQSQQAETSMNNKSNDVSNMNDEITNVNNSYDNLESSTINNMTDALDNLSFQQSNNLINNADFLSGANWIKTQVDKIINDLWMIRNIINFSLMIGIVLIFLGKVS